MTRQKLGQLGETLAAQYILAKGYQLIETNYRRLCGEIDLIAKDKDEFVFVEVRTKHKNLDSPVESVTWPKQRRIIKTAERYLTGRKIIWETPWRIDIIGIEFNRDGTLENIEHVKDAVEEC